MRHDRGKHGANVLGRRLLGLSRREEITGKAKLIVDFDLARTSNGTREFLLLIEGVWDAKMTK